MSRLQAYAKSVETLPRDTRETTYHRLGIEVQDQIATAGVMVPSLGMPGERPLGRHTVLAQRDQKQSAETALDADSIETCDGDGFSSSETAQAWPTNSTSHERDRGSVGEPIGLELAARRWGPNLSGSGII